MNDDNSGTNEREITTARKDLRIFRKSDFDTPDVGSLRNKEILQIMAQVFDADVYQFEVGNSAALGAALRAYHAAEKASGGSVSWEEVIAGFAEPVGESRISPEPELVALYNDLKPVYEACEEHALGRGEDPGQKIKAFVQR